MSFFKTKKGIILAIIFFPVILFFGFIIIEVIVDPGMPYKYHSGKLSDFQLKYGNEYVDPDSKVLSSLLDKNGASPVEFKSEVDDNLIFSLSSETELTIPKGWGAFQDGKKTTIFTPETGDCRIKLAFVSTSNPSTFFGHYKFMLEVDQNIHQLDSKSKAEFISTPTGDFGYITILNGIKYIAIYTVDKNHSGYAFQQSMDAPEDKFDSYLPLFDLIYQNRKITWDDDSVQIYDFGVSTSTK